MNAICLTILLAQVALQQPSPVPQETQIENAKQAYSLLNKLAEDALSLEDTVGRKRVSVVNQVLTYDFRPERSTALVSRPDRLTIPLEVLIRAAVLTRDLQAALPGEVFWVEPLKHIQVLASQIVQTAYDTTPDNEWSVKLRAFQDQTEADFSSLKTSLLEYAARSKLNVEGTRGLSNGYQVEIRINPQKARIRFVPFLDYMRCQYFHKSLEDEWNDLNEGTNTLIGRYHYRAEWPKSLNGPEEGNFEVHGNSTITFRPKEN